MVLGRGQGAGVPRKRQRRGGQESARKTHTRLQNQGAEKSHRGHEGKHEMLAQSTAKRSPRAMGMDHLPGQEPSPCLFRPSGHSARYHSSRPFPNPLTCNQELRTENGP